MSKPETDFSYGVLVHPPFIKFLDGHLASIKAAQDKYAPKVQIFIIFSFITDPKQIDQVKEIIGRYKDLSIKLTTINEGPPVSALRNRLQKMMPTPWKIFTDVDTLVE